MTISIENLAHSIAMRMVELDGTEAPFDMLWEAIIDEFTAAGIDMSQIVTWATQRQHRRAKVEL